MSRLNKKKKKTVEILLQVRIVEEIIFWSSHRRFFFSYLVASVQTHAGIVVRFSKCFCSYVQARISCLERRRGSHL